METDHKPRLNQSFPKQERLSSKKQIKLLFDTGKKLKAGKIMAVYLFHSEKNRYHQVLISVSSKKFKKAVDRNLIKRRIREAYRKNKDGLYTTGSSKRLMIAYIYNHQSICTYSEIEEAVRHINNQLEAILEKE